MKPFEDARQAIKDEKFDTARDLLRVYIKEEPESAEVWYLAALAAVNHAQKIVFLKKAVELDPLHAHAANLLYDIQHPDELIRTVKPEATTPEPVNETEADSNQPKYAPIENRIGAFMIDQIILMIALAPLIYLFGLLFLGGTSQEEQNIAFTRFISYVFVASNLLQALYYAYCLTQQEGQTIGKKYMNVRVVKRDGSAISLWDAILRSIFGYTFSGLSFGIGFLWANYDKQAQGWHDMIADTIVVRE